MSLPELDNLVRIGQLKTEPPSVLELQRLISMARTRLVDAQMVNLSAEGRFISAYNAAHGAALAALRWHGYRSEHRYSVFLALTHTLNWPASQWRILEIAHRKRNLAEYEGYLEVEESTIVELCSLASHLIEEVTMLVKN